MSGCGSADRKQSPEVESGSADAAFLVGGTALLEDEFADRTGGWEGFTAWRIAAVGTRELSLEHSVDVKFVPPEQAISLSVLQSQPSPQIGDLVLSELTDPFWHLGLYQGRAGEEALVCERAGSKHFPSSKVHRVPDALAKSWADRRVRLEIVREARNLVPRRPDDWVPKLGDAVVVWSSEGLVPGKIDDVDGPTFYVTPSTYGPSCSRTFCEHSAQSTTSSTQGDRGKLCSSTGQDTASPKPDARWDTTAIRSTEATGWGGSHRKATAPRPRHPRTGLEARPNSPPQRRWPTS